MPPNTHIKSDSADSTGSESSVLTCRSREYIDFLQSNPPNYDLSLLKKGGLTVIAKHQDALREASTRIKYNLDGMLYGMLLDAPHPDGTRYVTSCLHYYSTKGTEALVKAALAWLNTLLIPRMRFFELFES